MKQDKIGLLVIMCLFFFKMSVTTVHADEGYTKVIAETESHMKVTGELNPKIDTPIDEDDGSKIPVEGNITIPRQQVSVDTLPKTGENQQQWLFTLVGLSTLLLLFLLRVNQRKKQYEQNK